MPVWQDILKMSSEVHCIELWKPPNSISVMVTILLASLCILLPDIFAVGGENGMRENKWVGGEGHQAVPAQQGRSANPALKECGDEADAHSVLPKQSETSMGQRLMGGGEVPGKKKVTCIVFALIQQIPLCYFCNHFCFRKVYSWSKEWSRGSSFTEWDRWQYPYSFWLLF